MTGSGAQAAPDEALYPAAQCAALWLGFSEYAKRSPFLDYNPDDLKRSDVFRRIALSLSPDRQPLIDQTIATERAAMALLVEAMIYGGDAQSRDVFERLTQRCEDFAAQYPEISDPD